MDLRNSFSKVKKKVKHQLTGRKHKPARNEAGTDGEIDGSTSSLPRPDPHVVADDGEGSGANPDGRQACSTVLPPQLDEPGPAGESENGQGEGGVDVDGREVSQSYPHLHFDVGVAIGSGPGRGDDAGEEERRGKTDGV